MRVAAVLAALVVALAFASLGSGAVRVPPAEVARIAAAVAGLDVGAVDPLHAGVVTELRAPRTLLAIAVGATLAGSGALLQGLFRNPLVEPGLVGVSSGAALAAALALLAAPPVPLPLAAFAGGLAATLATASLARGPTGTVATWLLLAGVAVNATCGALVGLVLFVADDVALRSFTFWTLGSLGGATWPAVATVLALGALPVAAATRLAPSLDALALGDAEAAHLGVAVERSKAVVVLVTASGVGACVATCGTVGFVGLVAPHLVRLATSPSHRVVLPASLCAGAALVLAADILARTVVAPAELPIGVVTACVGAPMLLGLVVRARRQEVAC